MERYLTKDTKTNYVGIFISHSSDNNFAIVNPVDVESDKRFNYFIPLHRNMLEDTIVFSAFRQINSSDLDFSSASSLYSSIYKNLPNLLPLYTNVQKEEFYKQVSKYSTPTSTSKDVSNFLSAFEKIANDLIDADSMVKSNQIQNILNEESQNTSDYDKYRNASQKTTATTKNY